MNLLSSLNCVDTSNTGWVKSRFSVVSMQNSLFLYCYLLYYFSIQTAVNLICPNLYILCYLLYIIIYVIHATFTQIVTCDRYPPHAHTENGIFLSHNSFTSCNNMNKTWGIRLSEISQRMTNTLVSPIWGI